MREIKFRVWNKKTSFFIAHGKEDRITFSVLEYGKYYASWGQYCNPYYSKDSDYVFQQFTGLKDGQDREICEGDILKDKNGMLFEVFCLDTHASFELAEKQELPDGYSAPKFCHPCVSEINIVGNIFENPKL